MVTKGQQQPKGKTKPSIGSRNAVEELRCVNIKKICARYGNPSIKAADGNIYPLSAYAMHRGMTPQQAELVALRGQRKQVAAVHSHATRNDLVRTKGHAKAVEAAAAINCGAVSEQRAGRLYDEQTMNLALSDKYRTTSLHTIMHDVIRAAGMHYRPGQYDNGFIRTAYDANEKLNKRIEAAGGAGFGTLSLTGILSNLANKAMVAMFDTVENTIDEIAAQRPVNDFKDHASYRMIGIGEFERIGPTGELKEMQLSEAEYKNRIATFGATVTLTRQAQINDDLGAFADVPKAIGRKSAIKYQKEGWGLYLSNPTVPSTGNAFFSVGHNNYQTGAASDLGIGSLTTAYQLLEEQVDEDGDPIVLSGALVVVSPASKRTGIEIRDEKTIIMETLGTEGTPSRIPNHNPHAGEFRLIPSVWLGSRAGLGGNDTNWILTALPSDVPTVEAAHLNGKRTPTIESGETDYRSLGIYYRSYFDFGFAMQEYRAGVWSDGQ